jgi:hypothetical protein
MAEILERPPVEPIYTTPERASTIEYGEIEVVVNTETTMTRSRSTARLYLQLFPADELLIAIPSNHKRLEDYCAFSPTSDILKFEIPKFGTSFEAFFRSGATERTLYALSQSSIQLHPQSSSISKAFFHLFNWPTFYGPQNVGIRTGVPPHYGAKSCDCLIIEFDGWKIVISATEQTGDLVKSLNENGGYRITHSGSIERDDCKSFSSTDLDDVIEAMTFLFSFSLGRWRGPSLIIGFDQRKKIAYEHFGIGRVAPGGQNGIHSCFDHRHSDFLPALAPGFWKRWRDPNWRRSIKSAIYWYVGANTTGSGVNVDSGILFTQAALELLAWTYFVIDIKKYSENKFDKVKAAEKFRLLATDLNIPASIPPQLTGLIPPTGEPWRNAGHAISSIRNGLVHPGKAPYNHESYVDAWMLSLWHIEMVLLRVCGYEGKYSNRLVPRYAGMVEDVPWATCQDSSSVQVNRLS